MAITAAQLKTKFPELAAITDAFIDEQIVESELLINDGVWGDVNDLGLLYLTAHLVVTNTDDDDGTMGQTLTSKSVGSVSLSFATGAVSDEALGSTKYGRRYMQLRSMVTAGGFAAV